MSLIAPDLPADLLQRSRSYCRQITRTEARNFYYGLKLLPEPKRSAMFALYAYMRRVDDIADEQDGRSLSQRAARLQLWRQQTRSAIDGRAMGEDDDDLWPALAQAVRRHRIPPLVFDEVIAGQQADLEPVAFESFESLRHYCYQVAGVVGLGSIYVWGFEGGAATEALAVDRGIAFQLTNILRDLREDAARGRLYLPAEDLARFGITEQELTSPDPPPQFEELMRFEIERAQSFYARSAPLEERIAPDCRPTLTAMTQIYHGLLEKIAARPRRILSQRVSLSLLSKLQIGWRAVRAQ